MIQTAELTIGLYALLSGDATLAALIADYQDSPAVFTGLVPPDDLIYTRDGAGVWPIVVVGPVNGAARADLGGLFDVVRVIELYQQRTGDAIPIERAGDRVAELLDATPIALAVAGHDVALLDALPPVEIEGPDTETIARGVAITLQLSKE
jgi:hypothetical protein